MENPFERIDERISRMELLLNVLVEETKAPKTIPTNPNKRLSCKEVSEEYGISKATIYKYMREGKLAYSKLGRRTLFKREDIEHCISTKGKHSSV